MFSWFKEASASPAPLVLSLEVDEERTFTTLERITGRLTVRPLADTDFDSLDIKLLGISRTYGRRVVPQAPNARTVRTAHRFLELTQPDVSLYFPEDRMFRAGCVYSFPFQFAVPDRMLPATCRHPVLSPHVHQLHTAMPPSFGDQEYHQWPDYAPRHATISYRIVGEARRVGSPNEDPQIGLIGSSSKRIHFTPTIEAPAPTNDAWMDPRSILESVALKKLWAKPVGKLAVTSVQCTPFWIREPQSEMWSGHLSGRIRVKIAFYPAYRETKPPPQIKLNGMLRSVTTSAVRPLPQLPSDNPWQGPELDRHTAPSIILSSRVDKGIAWSPHQPHQTARFSDLPAYDTLPFDTSTQPMHQNLYYSAEIETSMNAAIACSLVPTFDSCLVSRSYSIELTLSMQSPAIASISAVNFTAPVQLVRDQETWQRDSTIASSDSDEDSQRSQVLGAVREPVRGSSRTSDPFDAPPRYECRV